MAEFMLLIRNGNWENYSPEEAQQAVQRYMAWARKLREEGRFKGGDELQGNGRILKKEGGRIVDGPFAETKEQLLGFYVVNCANLAEALDIARELGKANPGGAYEIRPISIFSPGRIAT